MSQPAWPQLALPNQRDSRPLTPARHPSRVTSGFASQATNLSEKPARISSRILSQARAQLQLQPRPSKQSDPGPRDFRAVSSAKPAQIWCQLQPRPSISSSWFTASLHSTYQPDNMIFWAEILSFDAGHGSLLKEGCAANIGRFFHQFLV
ncbi:hypothetical protein TIFTF001_010817 [Ficus carica]|uniref:Uncharacterized protein n=1 Tax=Ficus carica TaxID=3494 RepID=A0AA88D4S9_FICCA|nr:hypothetical protein TIFTF001_010817 [Ficus carica]